jgi:hypothetical protein
MKDDDSMEYKQQTIAALKAKMGIREFVLNFFHGLLLIPLRSVASGVPFLNGVGRERLRSNF